jgi:uncharacterized protein (TIGR03084 family)
VDMHTICADLQAEQADLDTFLSRVDEADWNTPTPAPGWMVRDQISHLGTTDRTATIAAAEPERFTTEITTQTRQERMQRQLDMRRLRGPELLVWWRTGRTAMLEVFRHLDPTARIPWFGPAMSAVSFATARLMETWAHGQDIADALGWQRSPSERLRHVAHIGIQARPFSFRNRGVEPPSEPIRVELVSPAGALWTWGEATASNRVSGPAVDFCLVVTQRRHPADTALRIAGPVATQWMQLAQAFAGPPGEGRQPGQFAPRP